MEATLKEARTRVKETQEDLCTAETMEARRTAGTWVESSLMARGVPELARLESTPRPRTTWTGSTASCQVNTSL